MSSAAAEDLVPHHPSSPGLICFAEQRARGCHTGLVENAAIVAERAGKRLRSSTVQPPCLPSLGQQQLPLDIPVGPNATCASASSTAYPLSFRAHLSGTELAIIHPPTHPHGAALLYRPNGRPAMSASLVHPKLDTLPALDMESDRLARACGQGPSFSARSSFSEDAGGPSYHDRPRTPERRGQSSSSLQRGSPPRWEYSDFSGLGLGPGPGLASPRGIRPRPHSVRVPARVSPVPPIPHRPRSFSQPASIPVFSPSSPRPVLRSLQAVLDRDDVQLADCLDVQSVLERWTIHRRLRPVAAVEGQEGATNKTFGSPVTVAVKCASMSTVLGGYQHPIPWVVYACVEELNRTGIYQPGLFRAVPNRSRLEKLISGFDCALPPPRSESPCPPCVPTVSSTRASLRKESMADVCALLKSYMDSLPEPLLHDNITSALHRLCVVPSDKREQEKPTCEHHESGGYFHLPPSISSSRMSAACTHSRTRSDPVSPKSLSPLLMTPSERRSADLSLENSQIHIAQHLLRLTAPPLCSLFAYLCAFFTQLPLSPDNGITLEDVSRMFGRSLAGGPVSTRNAVLMWLLERWPRVADGIFSICSGDPDEDEDVATSVYPPFAPAIAPCTDDATQSPDSTPHPPYSVPEVSVIEVRRRGSLISLDGTESVFTASTTSSDDGVHGVRTPFSSEFPPLPLPAVREYEFEPEWEEPPSVHPMLNGGVGNGMAALSSSTEAHSPGSSSQAILALHTAADGSLDFKRPALSHSRMDSLRSPSPHSPPPDSEYDSPSPSAAHSRSASRAGASSSQVEGASRPTPESPLSIFRRFGFKESNPHRSLSVRKKKKITTPHRRGASDADSASSGAVEH